MREPMSFRVWWDHVGIENIERVIAELGSSLGYFRQLRYGTKAPSEQMARRIIAAAKAITPPFAPDLQLVLDGEPKPKPYGGPSKEFLAAQKRRGRG